MQHKTGVLRVDSAINEMLEKLVSKNKLASTDLSVLHTIKYLPSVRGIKDASCMSVFQGLHIFGELVDSDLRGLKWLNFSKKLLQFETKYCILNSVDGIEQLPCFGEIALVCSIVEDASAISRWLQMLSDDKRQRVHINLKGSRLDEETFNYLDERYGHLKSSRIKIPTRAEWEITEEFYQRGYPLVVTKVAGKKGNETMLVHWVWGPNGPDNARRSHYMGRKRLEEWMQEYGHDVAAIWEAQERVYEENRRNRPPAPPPKPIFKPEQHYEYGDQTQALAWLEDSRLEEQEKDKLRRHIQRFPTGKFSRMDEECLEYYEKEAKLTFPDWLKEVYLTLDGMANLCRLKRFDTSGWHNEIAKQNKMTIIHHGPPSPALPFVSVAYFVPAYYFIWIDVRKKNRRLMMSQVDELLREDSLEKEGIPVFEDYFDLYEQIEAIEVKNDRGEWEWHKAIDVD
jgi:hypothetical protein